jgi:hypothetical protein
MGDDDARRLRHQEDDDLWHGAHGVMRRKRFGGWGEG